MPVTTVNPWHWLNEDGTLPTEPKLRRRMLRVAQFIEYGGPLAIGHGRLTLTPCERQRDGVECLGQMMVLKHCDDSILAFCFDCHEDEFLIYDWESTEWADGPAEPLSVAAFKGGVLPEQRVTPERRDELLGP